ncbi:MAG: hypothetical protein BWY95_00241 [Bacteroidetes bacterium ADurb.BinA104]|jgi:hypothetical protein|nr:MAG: hypothetical protein BWY95_00241 [Bacteroidetes bacterium ADurb.BinA104]HQB97403.1 hypothetical protein [Candidatus Cloacimonadota bacterium]
MDIIANNSTYIIGIVAAIVVWLLSKMGIKNLDKAQIAAILTIILDIIQDIKTNPATKDMDDYSKKQLAVQRVEAALPQKKKKLIQKVFGSIGGAIEYVFHNKKELSKLPKTAKVVI